MSKRSENVTNLTLDEYYEQHVRPMNRRRNAGHGPNPTQGELVQHYRQTHFFGDAYPEQRQRLLTEPAMADTDDLAEQAKQREKQQAKLNKLEERKRKFAKFDEDQKSKVNSEKKHAPTKPKDVQAKETSTRSHKERSVTVDTCSRETKRNNQRRPKSKERAREKKTTPKEEKPKEVANEANGPEPLVLKIGDEVLYDEAYKNDPLWMQHVDLNYTY